MRKYLYASRTTGLSGNRVATWAIDPDGTTAGDALGWAFTSFGTVDVPDLSVETTPSDSDFRTQLDRMTFTSSSTPDSTAGLISSAPVANRGSAAGRGGVAFSIRFALPELFDATRGFIGLSSSSTSLLVANPYVGDVIGIGFGGNDTTADPFRLIHFNDVTGAYDAILGAERDPDSVYELSILAAPNASTATVRLVELRTGAVLLDDRVVATTLPTASEMLYVHATVGSGPTLDPEPDPPRTPAIDVVAMRLEVPDGDRAPEVLGASGYFSVKDFGAFGNYDPNDLSPHDDTPAFRAALRAMAGRGGILFIPPGDYFLASNLLVDLNLCGSILVQGVLRGTARSLSRVHFGDKCGIRVVAPATPRDHTEDAGPPVLDEFEMPTFGAENLTLLGRGPRAVDSDAWADGEEYFEGMPVVMPIGSPGASFEYYYECISDGTSGSTPPDFAATFRPAPDLVWSVDTTYAVNDVVRVAGIFDRIFLCIESGGDHESGGAPPTWPAIDGVVDDGDLWWRAFDAETYFVADGGTLSSPTGPVWACRTAPGIYSEARVSLRRVATQKFFNSGVHLQVPDADRVHACAGWGSHVFDVESQNIGGGFVARERADEGSFAGVFVRPYHDVAEPEYLRHLGIVDRSTYGNSYVGSRLESYGVALTVHGEDNAGTSFGDYYESNPLDFDIDAPKFSVWGSGAGDYWRPTNAYGVVTTMEWKNVQSTSMSTVDPLDPMTTPVELSIEARPNADQLFAFGSNDDSDPFAYVYEQPEAGWWGFLHGATVVVAYSEESTATAQAKVWLPRGFRLGPDATAKWIRSADFSTLGPGGTIGELVFNANPVSMDPVFKYFDGTSWLDGPIL